MKPNVILLSLSFIILGNSIFAQKTYEEMRKEAHRNNPFFDGPSQNVDIRTSYFTTGFEGMILQTSSFSKPGQSSKLSTLRFTNFFHTGINYHKDFSSSTGFFVGLGLKNIGFIEKFDANDSTVKRRIYALEVPLALKFGKLHEDRYGFVGVGADFALNYKEKGYVKRSDKDKFNEWFSERTPLIMPTVFVGYRTRLGFYIKANYYPSNFLNTDFVDKTTNTKPYEGYKVNLITLTAGLNIRMKPKHKDAESTKEATQEVSEEIIEEI